MKNPTPRKRRKIITRNKKALYELQELLISDFSRELVEGNKDTAALLHKVVTDIQTLRTTLGINGENK